MYGMYNVVYTRMYEIE